MRVPRNLATARPCLVLVDGLAGDEQHRAHAARSLGEVDELGGGGEDVAGADRLVVLEVGAAVEDPLVGALEAA